MVNSSFADLVYGLGFSPSCVSMVFSNLSSQLLCLTILVLYHFISSLSEMFCRNQDSNSSSSFFNFLPPCSKILKQAKVSAILCLEKDLPPECNSLLSRLLYEFLPATVLARRFRYQMRDKDLLR